MFSILHCHNFIIIFFSRYVIFNVPVHARTIPAVSSWFMNSSFSSQVVKNCHVNVHYVNSFSNVHHLNSAVCPHSVPDVRGLILRHDLHDPGAEHRALPRGLPASPVPGQGHTEGALLYSASGNEIFVEILRERFI